MTANLSPVCDAEKRRKIEHRMWCAREVERFACFPFRPPDAGVTEIFNALVKWTINEAHATAVVNELIDAEPDSRGPRWPTPHEIHQAANGTRPAPEPEKMVKPEIACKKCRDIGNINTGTGYQRCDCELGQSYPQELLDALNRPRKPRLQAQLLPTVLKRGLQPIHPITRADIDAAIEKHKQAKAPKAQPSKPITPEVA